MTASRPAVFGLSEVRVRSRMCLVGLAAAGILTIGTQAGAQAVAETPVLGVGVSFLSDNGSGNETDIATGLFVDIAVPVSSTRTISIGAVGDFGFNRFTDGDVSITSYLGGVRFTGLSSDRIRPFGQFLIGMEHCCGGTDFAWQPGGGLDVVINEILNFRAQYDFRVVRFEGENFNESRFLFGISMPVGR